MEEITPKKFIIEYSDITYKLGNNPKKFMKKMKHYL